MNLVYVGCVLLGIGSVVFIHSNTSLEDSNFSFVSFYQLEITSGSEMEASVHFPSWCWDTIWARSTQTLSMGHSFCEFISGSVLVCLEMPSFLVSPILSGSYIFSHLFMQCSLGPRDGEGFNRDFVF